MNRIAAYILAALALASCSRREDPQPVPPGPRPGEEPAAESRRPAMIRLEPREAEIATGATASGTVVLTMTRSGDNLPDTLYNIESEPGGITLGFDSGVRFGKDATTASIPVDYRCTLEPQQQRRAVLSVRAHVDSAAQTFTLTLKRPTQWVEIARGRYVSGTEVREAVLEERRTTGGTDFRITAGDRATEYTVDAQGLTHVVNREAYGGTWADGRMVSVAAADGTMAYFINNTLDVRVLPGCTFTDGWITGVVSIEARPPLEPADNPWPVLMLESRAKAGELYLVDPYRAPCPLAGINFAKGLTVLGIDATTAAAVTMAPQEAGFVNTDLFARKLIIGGTGTLATAGKRRLTLTALHNAKGEYPGMWANGWKTIIDLTE